VQVRPDAELPRVGRAGRESETGEHHTHRECRVKHGPLVSVSAIRATTDFRRRLYLHGRTGTQHLDKVLVPFAPDDPSHRTFVELEGLHETIRGGVLRRSYKPGSQVRSMH